MDLGIVKYYGSISNNSRGGPGRRVGRAGPPRRAGPKEIMFLNH